MRVGQWKKIRVPHAKGPGVGGPQYPTMIALADPGRVWVLLGRSIKDDLAEVLKKTKDAEVRFRLEKVIAELQGDGADDGQAALVGGYEIRRAFGMFTHPDGQLIVSADDIRKGDEKLGKGSIIRNARGEVRFAMPEEFPRIFHNCTNLTHYGWLPVAGGEQMWFSGSNYDPPMLLDLKTMQVQQRIDHIAAKHLLAVRRDGTLYLRPGLFRPEDRDKSPDPETIWVWRPEIE